MPDQAPVRRRLASGMRSLRVRITLVATGAVLLALVLAGVALVASIRGTLVGRMRDAAATEVERAAAELRRVGPSLESTPAATELGMGVVVVSPSGDIVAARGQALMVLPRPLTDVLQRVETPPAEGVAEVALALGSNDVVVAQRTVTLSDGNYRVVAISPLAEASRSINAVVRALVIATPVLTLFVGALCWFAVDRTLRPVDQVRRRAEAISYANLDERLPVPATGDEIERLTRTLNDMLHRLAAAMRRQREFVSDTAHELRTPLATIRTELEVALAHDDADGWRMTATQLLSDHRRVEHLAHDLLTLARLDESTTQHRDEVQLDEVVAAETTMLDDDAVDLAAVTVHGDIAALARAMRNLVDNACRHAASRVEVRLVANGDYAILWVDDDGPGIPETQRDRVFERFSRLDEARSRDAGGSGIGLAIVRRVADVHGGTVDIADAPIGGARFELRLPLSHR
jgi:signal transduction histidine kinase